MEVLVQTEAGWFPPHDETPYRQPLGNYENDFEVFRHGRWHRAALISVYSRGTRLGENDGCQINFEEGKAFLSWQELRNNTRPHNQKSFDFLPGKESFDIAIDENPLDWVLRCVYADWLEENGYVWLADGQRYQIQHQKTPAPACVSEANWHEASWFNEHTVGGEWCMQGNYKATIKPEWCVPRNIFVALSGYLLQRRDGGSHNIHAKSWNSRRETEIGLALALRDENALHRNQA